MCGNCEKLETLLDRLERIVERAEAVGVTSKQRAKETPKTHEEKVQAALDYLGENQARLQAIYPNLASPDAWKREVVDKFLDWSEKRHTAFDKKKDYQKFFANWCRNANEFVGYSGPRPQRGFSKEKAEENIRQAVELRKSKREQPQGQDADADVWGD